jgi:WD40 repeat protein
MASHNHMIDHGIWRNHFLTFTMASIVLLGLALRGCGAMDRLPALPTNPPAILLTFEKTKTLSIASTFGRTATFQILTDTRFHFPATYEPISLDNTNKITELLRWGVDRLISIRFSPAGQTLAEATYHGITLYGIVSDSQMRFIETYTSPTDITFSPDGKILAAGLMDHTIKLWDSSDGKMIREIDGLYDQVTCIAFSPDGKILASGSGYGQIKLWGISDGKLSGKLGVSPSFQYSDSIAFSPDGKQIALILKNGPIKLWGVPEGELMQTLELPKPMQAEDGRTFLSIAFSPDGRLLASSIVDGTIILWGISDGKIRLKMSGQDSEPYIVTFSPDSKLLAAGLFDGHIGLWNVADGKLLQLLDSHTLNVSNLSFSPDGKLLASGSWDGTVRLWGISQQTIDLQQGD